MKNKQNNSIVILSAAILVVGTLLLAFVGGYQYGVHRVENSVANTDTMSVTKGSMNHDAVDHKDYVVTDSNLAPKITDFSVEKDMMSGWNLSFETENFKFSPENASTKHVDGQGHAHLYVDGKKITRLYGGQFYIDDLAPGDHQIRVSLNTNDHQEYHLSSGGAIEATTLITQN